MNDPDWIYGFDADDTLWHNEKVFRLTGDRFSSLLAPYAPKADLSARLEAAERRNLGRYGFGIKGFMLSMIETALEVSDGQVPGAVIYDLIEAGHQMLAHPVDLLPHAAETVAEMRRRGRVVLITKGDLVDQERKLAASGLGALFDAVEIVSDKTPQTYARIFAGAAGALMVGNSLRSDVIPALEAGAWGVHAPQDLAWAYEAADAPIHHPKFRQITDLSELPDIASDLASDLAPERAADRR